MILNQSPIDVASQIRSTVEMMRVSADEKRLNLNLNISEKIPRILIGDSARLHQVLVNVISNAIKFTSSGGVDISVECDKDCTICSKLHIEIRDTGVGIPANCIENIFDKYEQVDSNPRRPGVGLGLNITRELVQLMGGEIYCVSEVGKGSTFTIGIPFLNIDDDTKAISIGGDQSRDIRELNLKVLLVDDSEEFHFLFRTFLEKSRCVLDVVSTGDDAIKMYRQNRYDIVFLDLVLSDEDGYGVAKEISLYDEAKGRVQSPLVALSGLNTKDIVEKCISGPFISYLSKPIRKKELIDFLFNL